MNIAYNFCRVEAGYCSNVYYAQIKASISMPLICELCEDKFYPSYLY